MNARGTTDFGVGVVIDAHEAIGIQNPDDPFLVAGGDTQVEAGDDNEGVEPQADDYGPKRSATVIPFRKTPIDRLPGFFGAPPRLSLYHTKRAQDARERAGAGLTDYWPDVSAILSGAGLRRYKDAGVFEHNALTLASALSMAELGLHVIDSHAVDPKTGLGTGWAAGRNSAKIPRGTGWERRASNDRDKIIRGWVGAGIYPVGKAKKPPKDYDKVWCPRNVSIAFPPGCNLFVLDVDGPLGLANLQALLAEHGPLPKTVAQMTGSGGLHYIFRGAGRPIYNSASEVATKIDIRGEGGQMLAAPSIHETGGFYLWLDGCSPRECAIAVAPEWLEKKAFEASKQHKPEAAKKVRTRRAPSGTYKARGEKNARTFDERLASFGDGPGRVGFHNAIYAAACAWWFAFPDGDADDLKEVLREAILDAPCDDDRAVTRYAPDYYLDGEIEAARTWIESLRAKEQATRASEALTVTTAAEVRKAAESAGIDADTPEAGLLAFFRRLADGGTDAVGWAAVVEVFAAERGKKNPITRLGKKVITDYIASAKKATKNNPRPDTAGRGLVGEQDFAELCTFGQRQIDNANAAEPTVFHFGDGLVRVREDSEGRLRLRVMLRDDFAHYLNSVASYAKLSGEDGELRGVSAPDDVVRHLLAADYGIYHPLVGTTEIPIFTKSGSRLTAAGYDPASRLYYRPDPALIIPEVPENPTDADLRKAKSILIRDALGDFPLDGRRRAELEQVIDNAEVSIPSLANTLAMFVLIFMRDMVDGPTPGHLLNKPGPGTGASLLTDLLAIVATGEDAEAQTLPENKEEVSKTLTTNVMDGQPIILFDNINSAIGGDVLASAMTSGKYSARILGKNESVKQRIRGLWVFTGNNIVLTPEMVRRFVLIYLNAGTATPEKRTGFLHRDVKAWAKENRGELVWACLTLIQNWVAAGMPDGGYRLASFDDWARKVSGVLEAAGIFGLGQNAEKLADLSESGDQPEDYLLQRLVEDLRAQMGLAPDGKRMTDDKGGPVVVIPPATEPRALWITVGDVTYQKRKPVNIMDLLNNFHPGENGKSPLSLRIRGYNYNRDGIYEDAGALGKAFSARFLGDAKNDKSKTARHLVKLVHEDGTPETVEVEFSLVGKPQGAGKVYRMELV